MKKLIFAFATVLFLFFVNACTEGEGEFGTCSGCPSNAPYSKGSGNSCYPTLQECENALGAGCQVCN